MMTKKLIAICFAIFTISLSSCNNDCDVPIVTENIIGTWELENGGEISFESDGTFIDPNDSFYGNGILEVDKTWTITNNELMIVAGNFTSVYFPIVKNECDEIIVDYVGTNRRMTRI